MEWLDFGIFNFWDSARASRESVVIIQEMYSSSNSSPRAVCMYVV